MILTVTLNAAIDRTLTVPNFSLGFRHRATDALTLPGGKGVNVARVIKTLGFPVIATGFAGGRTGDRIVASLSRAGILCDFVPIEGESRTSTAVVDPTSGVATEINEHGPDIAPHEMELMIDKLAYLLKAAHVVVLAGSLPRSIEPGIYSQLIGLVRAQGIPVLFDTFGEALRLGIKAGPDVVFPNQIEAEMVIGYEFSDYADIVNGAAGLRELGAKSAVITDRRGCVAQFVQDGGDMTTVIGRSPQVEAVSAVGSGDALLGGYAAGLLDQRGPLECLRLGLACAAANTLRYGAGVFSAEEATRLAERVVIEEVVA
jgi:1-phosphofructokinase family hexose kinase